ncbi:MAG: SAF domain-containing protein [Betaproteobacteria bacterium]|nr:SAF domain-containing protein [Betaproteobacteria bacterium]MDE2423523.1 SAF domain-containing protein [Betaproteobacteria bacterium]
MLTLKKHIISILSQQKSWWWIWFISLLSALVLGRFLFFSHANTTTLLVANKDLSIGHLITQNDLTPKPWPVESLPNGYFLNSSPLINQRITNEVNQGLPIVSHNIKSATFPHLSKQQNRLMTFTVKDSDIDTELLTQRSLIDLWYRENRDAQRTIIIHNVAIAHLHRKALEHEVQVTVELTNQELSELPQINNNWQLTLLLHPDQQHLQKTHQAQPVEIIRGVIP